MNSETRMCQNCKTNFVIEPEDFEFYEKMGVQIPSWCPTCRFIRRCLFRNEKTLYSRKCDLCGAPIISMYNPNREYIIYCNLCWDSDKWDPTSYGLEYNPKRPFFEQLGELLKRVPKKTTYNSSSSKYGPNINSDYTNVASGNKDCYLIFNSSGCENTLYSRGIVECRDTLDAYFGMKLERCYEVINVDQSSNIVLGQNVVGCFDSMFLLNASGCQNCFGCVNIRHKSYCFFNEQLSKDEYESKVREIRGSYEKTEKAKKRFKEHSLKFPKRENNNIKSVDSVGEYLFESKNVYNVFEATRSENCKHCFSIKFTKDSYDSMGYGYDSELLLECVGVGLSSRVIGSYWISSSHDIEYSYATESSEYCFGCDGLKHASYSILNKKYSKEDYKRIRDQIINSLKSENLYGSFLSPSIAPFSYNESVGPENISMTQEETLKLGFTWEDKIQITRGKETLKTELIPDHINDVPDSIVNEVLACVACGRNYKITPAEFELYKRIIIPIPRRCFFCRCDDRISKRGPMKIFDRICAKCNKPIKTTYAPDRPEIVYCEQCYRQEVV